MSKKWWFIIGGGVVLIGALTIYAGPGEVGKKTIFYTGAVAVLAAKILGFLSAGLAWPMFIVLAIAGTISDPTPTNAQDTLTAQGTIPAST